MRKNIDCSALIGLGSCIEMGVISSWKLVSDSRISVTAIFSSVTQTQTQTQLARVWLEYESSGIKMSVSGV